MKAIPQKVRNNFKPREKQCVICGETFTITEPLRTQDKTCSSDCRYKLARKISYESGEKLVKRKCRECSKEFMHRRKYRKVFCSSECQFKNLSQQRKGKGNPSYNKGLTIGKRTYTGKHLYACRKYRKAFLQKNEYLYCERCKVNENGTPHFVVHHIYFASAYPKHTELHNFKNLILLCVQCHNDFHAGKKIEKDFKTLEKKRGLKTLFTSKESV